MVPPRLPSTNGVACAAGGAQTVSVPCPRCSVMIGSSIKLVTHDGLIQKRLIKLSILHSLRASSPLFLPLLLLPGCLKAASRAAASSPLALGTALQRGMKNRVSIERPGSGQEKV